MARSSYASFVFFVQLALLVLSLVSSFTDARPFNAVKQSPGSSRPVPEFHDGLLEGLAQLRALKQSGPSPGEGNKSVGFRTFGLGGMKDGGPSPGQGH